MLFAQLNLSTKQKAEEVIRYGVVANIIASHAIARGSIPRVGSNGWKISFFPREWDARQITLVSDSQLDVEVATFYEE